MQVLQQSVQRRGIMEGRGPHGRRLPCAVSTLLLLLHTVIGALPEEAVFVPGTLPLDTDGKEVPALQVSLISPWLWIRPIELR